LERKGTGNKDGHAGVGPGSNTAKPEKERETKPPKPDGPEEAREAGIHSGASSPPPDPILPQGLMPKPALRLWDSRDRVRNYMFPCYDSPSGWPGLGNDTTCVHQIRDGAKSGYQRTRGDRALVFDKDAAPVDDTAR